MSSERDVLPRVMSLAVHELLTPLSVASGYLRMLLREQAGPLTDTQRKMLEEAERSCGRLNALTAEMRELGKVESGAAALARHDVDVSALLAEVAGSMHEGEDRGVRVELRRPDAPVMVTGDRPRLATALKALLHSALRERGEPGAVIAHCSTRTDTEPNYAVVAFADESLLPALLPHAGADSLAFDEWRGGTGMALPIARRVIEGHGGALWSAATAQELCALDLELRSNDPRNALSENQRAEFSRKRAAAALRLPLRN